MSSPRFRLLPWLIISVLLFLAAMAVASYFPSSPLAVTLYKAHLMSMGGWGGYWLDRVLFPYSRPHECFEEACFVADDHRDHGSPSAEAVNDELNDIMARAEMIMLRRALIVVGCLICVGLGA